MRPWVCAGLCCGCILVLRTGSNVVQHGVAHHVVVAVGGHALEDANAALALLVAKGAAVPIWLRMEGLAIQIPHEKPALRDDVKFPVGDHRPTAPGTGFKSGLAFKQADAENANFSPY